MLVSDLVFTLRGFSITAFEATKSWIFEIVSGVWQRDKALDDMFVL